MSPPLRPAHPTPRRPLPLLALALAAGGCATPPARQAWQNATPEVLVDVVPRRATLALDGQVLGQGGRTVPVPEAGRDYHLRAEAPGYLPAERTATGAQLAGARVVVLLRPEGFGSARVLDPADPSSVAAAGAAVERRGDHADALEYADLALEVAPDLPAAQRLAGDAAFGLGQRQRAIAAYSAYLAAAPHAPDVGQVARRMEALRGDVTLVPERRP